MWFTKSQFELCDELKSWGLTPRFETGDVVARGFADLGHEEFQVLPGKKLLSLTAGTSKPLPAEHEHHFFWIPSVDEAIELLERAGVSACSCERISGREWVVFAGREGVTQPFTAASLHEALLKALLATMKLLYKKSA